MSAMGKQGICPLTRHAATVRTRDIIFIWKCAEKPAAGVGSLWQPRYLHGGMRDGAMTGTRERLAGATNSVI